MTAPYMNSIHDPARDQDIRIENFAAELTRAVYQLMLRRGLRASWLSVELALWKALAEIVQKWARHRATASSDEFDPWPERLVVELAESAFYIALRNGIKGFLLDQEIYRAVRVVIRRRAWSEN